MEPIESRFAGCQKASKLRRPNNPNSSATVGSHSGGLMSTPKTQLPSF
jgi:hypothetical protein